MKKTWRVGLMSVLALALVGIWATTRQTEASSAQSAVRGVTTRVVDAANTFLATLSAEERARVTFGFTSNQRTGWSNLPSGIFQRNGLRLGDLTDRQRTAALALVASALSHDGYKKVTDIMNGDEVLRENGGGRTGGRPGPPAAAGRAGPGGPGRGGPGRGPGGRGGGVQFGRDEYYIALLGTPSTTTPWMLQFGGHHLAINVTFVGASNVMTPSLPAAQPAKYTLDGQTIRPLGHEHDKSYALINSMNAAQQKQAILPYSVTDLVLGPGNDGKVIQPEGVAATQLDAKQQTMLLDLAHEWVGILNDEAANAKMAELKANLPRTYFAWSGTTTDNGLAYFRIQGPTVVIEYAPQQGDADHIHTIYRDPTNDYGAKLVRK